MSSLTVSKATKKFGSVEVLKGISLCIESGEFLVLVGPYIFLFDEPLSNLDAKLRVEMRTEIKLLHKPINTTIVYVTHDQIEAMTLADRIAIMKDGVIQQFDTPQAVYDNPSNLFVAGFIGSPSMNFIPCRMTRQNSKIGVSLDAGNESPFFVPIEQAGPDLNSWLDREVILGIRPEKISHGFAEQDADHNIHEIESVVEVLEPTGPDTLVFIHINGKEVTCRVNPNHVKSPGQPMSFMIDMSNALLFDPVNGERIEK
jgi:multiple sugar transport system ATP-binding protein